MVRRSRISGERFFILCHDIHGGGGGLRWHVVVGRELEGEGEVEGESGRVEERIEERG